MTNLIYSVQKRWRQLSLKATMVSQGAYRAVTSLDPFIFGESFLSKPTGQTRDVYFLKINRETLDRGIVGPVIKL